MIGGFILAALFLCLVAIVTKNFMVVACAALPAIGLAFYVNGVLSGDIPMFPTSWITPFLLVVSVIILFILISVAIGTLGSIFTDVSQSMDIGRPQYTEANKGKHGATIGYKRLTLGNNYRPKSPLTGDEWIGHQLTANDMPTEDNSSGIYAVYSPKDRQLENYNYHDSILVELELRGQRVMHEHGVRAQFARITRILDVGEGITLSDGTNLRDYYKKNGRI